MPRPLRISVVHRRDVLLGAAAAAALIALGRPALAADQAKDPAAGSLFEQALDQILGEAKPIPGKIAIELPDIAENGNTVPYAVTVESPMTAADHVKAIHVLANANPLPSIASFGLTPHSGRAYVASRMRLAKTQDVVVVAALSNGRFIAGRRTVKVTIGGCGG